MSKYKIYYDEFENEIHKEKININQDIKNIESIDQFLATTLFKEIFKDGILDLTNFKKLKYIEAETFSNKNIKEIKLPKSVKLICSLAFANNQITNLDFSENVNLEVIEDYAFVNNPLDFKKAKMPNGIKSVGIN